MVPAAAFLCAKPTIHPSLKLKNLTVLEDSGSVSISPQDFMAPFGSLTLNITDQTGNEANMICSIQKPAMTSSIAFTAENDYIMLNASFSTFLVCDIDYSHIHTQLSLGQSCQRQKVLNLCMQGLFSHA